MARELIIKAGSISELELSLKVNHNFDKENEVYEILSEEKASGLKKLFASKTVYTVLVRGKNEKIVEKVIKPVVVKKEVKVETVPVKSEKVIPKPIKKESTPILKEEGLSQERKFREFAAKAISKELVLEKVTSLFNATKLDVKVVEVEEVDGNFNVIIEGESQGLIIGAKGKTLYSFEHIINQMFGLKYKKIFLNIEGFKEKRQETVERLANSVAKKVLRFEKPIRLNFMPANERKIIHEIISSYPELESVSEGQGPKRYVVVQRKKESHV